MPPTKVNNSNFRIKDPQKSLRWESAVLESGCKKKDPFNTRRDRSPETVTSNGSTGASKSVYQARPRTVAFYKKAGRPNALSGPIASFLHLPFNLTPPAI